MFIGMFTSSHTAAAEGEETLSATAAQGFPALLQSWPVCLDRRTVPGDDLVTVGSLTEFIGRGRVDPSLLGIVLLSVRGGLRDVLLFVRRCKDQQSPTRHPPTYMVGKV